MDISDFSDQANRYMTKQSTEFERDFRSNIQRRHIKHDGKTIEKKSKKKLTPANTWSSSRHNIFLLKYHFQHLYIYMLHNCTSLW